MEGWVLDANREPEKQIGGGCPGYGPESRDTARDWKQQPPSLSHDAPSRDYKPFPHYPSLYTSAADGKHRKSNKAL